MHILQSLIVAFSMYSAIPMPQIKWNDKNMRYAICFFPLIGAIIGAILILWYYICEFLALNSIIFAAFATYIPIFVTGGIHVDGFCDTIDALASCQPIERKMKILKDPNCGAFALIKTIMYFLITFSLYTQLEITGLLIISVGFVLERALSGLSIIHLKKAGTSGLAAMFSSRASRIIATITLSIIVFICVFSIFLINYKISIITLIFVCFAFLHYKYTAYKNFDGITGDIAGYFLQICEIFIISSTIIAKVVFNLWSL